MLQLCLQVDLDAQEIAYILGDGVPGAGSR